MLSFSILMEFRCASFSSVPVCKITRKSWNSHTLDVRNGITDNLDDFSKWDRNVYRVLRFSAREIQWVLRQLSLLRHNFQSCNTKVTTKGNQLLELCDPRKGYNMSELRTTCSPEIHGCWCWLLSVAHLAKHKFVGISNLELLWERSPRQPSTPPRAWSTVSD